MFPESFAEQWIAEYSRPGELVLDPFCGRGTTPFQALLMGRGAVACDINPVAYVITRAKTNAPSLKVARRRIGRLASGFRAAEWESARRSLPKFFRVAYQASTLRQILFLRSHLAWRRSDVDCMLAALALAALHGESARSPRYLSNQMPHTIATKPRYSVHFWRRHGYQAPRRDVFDLLDEHLIQRYAQGVPPARARVFLCDMRELAWTRHALPAPIRTVVTSPPYQDVTNFEEDQWLRLWFLGGPPEPTYRRVSRDDRLRSADDYWRMVADMWRMLGVLLAPNATVVIRIGARRVEPTVLLSQLAESARFARRRTQVLNYDVSAILGRQTNAFNPGSTGCKYEVDACIRVV